MKISVNSYFYNLYYVFSHLCSRHIASAFSMFFLNGFMFSKSIVFSRKSCGFLLYSFSDLENNSSVVSDRNLFTGVKKETCPQHVTGFSTITDRLAYTE